MLYPVRCMENQIDLRQFRQLLGTLENLDIGIRLRLTGERWTDHSKVVLLSEHAVLLQANGQHKLISNIGNIVEFEIDKPVDAFEADRVYSIAYL